MFSGTNSNLLDFVHSNSGDWTIRNIASDKDIIFDVKKIDIKKLNRREIEIINFELGNSFLQIS